MPARCVYSRMRMYADLATEVGILSEGTFWGVYPCPLEEDQPEKPCLQPVAIEVGLVGGAGVFEG